MKRFARPEFSWRLAAVGVLLGVVGTPGAAQAHNAEATATAQAIAAHAQFLAFTSPPATPGVVCLVDTGVSRNPDTAPALVGAEALDPTWGTQDGYPQADLSLDAGGHGTDMAMAIAAPRNGWGMVGLAPTAVRVYSIRDSPPEGQPTTLADVDAAISRCVEIHDTTQPTMTTINISEATTSAVSSDDLAAVKAAVDLARADGLSVVAGAGNDGAAAPGYPAAYGPVVAVGAGDAESHHGSALCGFSVHGHLDLVAPGCDSVMGGVTAATETGEATVITGTSESTALVSGALAALRAYAPLLTADQAQACLTGTAHGQAIDVAAAFDACGLRAVVDAGRRYVQRSLPAPHLRPPARIQGQMIYSVASIPPGEALEMWWLKRTEKGLSAIGYSNRWTRTTFKFALSGTAELAVRLVQTRGPRVSRWVTENLR